MSSNARRRSALIAAHAGPRLAVAISLGLGACSADVTRFDFPNLSDNGAPTGALAGAAGPRPAQGFEVAGGAPPRGVGAPDEATEGYPPARLASARDYAPQTAPLPPLVPEHRP